MAAPVVDELEGLASDGHVFFGDHLEESNEVDAILGTLAIVPRQHLHRDEVRNEVERRQSRALSRGMPA